MKLIHIIVEGPDGAGKSTMVNHLKDRLPNSISFSVGKVDQLFDIGGNYFTLLSPDEINVMFNLKTHSTLEKSLHLYRHSLTFAEITNQVKSKILNEDVDVIYLIQDRSWVSSVIYNNMDKELAHNHFNESIDEMLSNINDYFRRINNTKIEYIREYLHIYASTDTLDRRRKSRGTTDVYEESNKSLELLEKYHDTFKWLKHTHLGTNLTHHINEDGKQMDLLHRLLQKFYIVYLKRSNE